jgi:WD40 repeat protein
MTSPTFLIAGLDNGGFCGWDLTTNTFNEIKPHNAPITCLSVFRTYLLSGDASGVVKVFNIGDFSQLLEGRV